MFTRKNLRSVFFAMLMLSLSALLIGCGGGKSGVDELGSEDTVLIGTMNLVNGDLIAQYEKWYENELGVKVKVVRYDSGKDFITALAANSIDIGEARTSPAALAISNNLDVKVIFIGDIIGAAESLVVKKDSGIAGIKDLAGKKIATPFASTAHYSLLNALKLEGMSEKDIQLLDLQPDDIFAAWQRGDIDGAYICHPVLGRLLEDGKTVTNSAKLAEKGIITADLIVVRTSFAEKNPNFVKKFVGLQLRANDMIINEPEKAAKEISSFLEISEEDASEQITQFKYLKADEQIEYLNNSMAQTLKSTSDFLFEQKSIRNVPELEDFASKITSEFISK